MKFGNVTRIVVELVLIAITEALVPWTIVPFDRSAKKSAALAGETVLLNVKSSAVWLVSSFTSVRSGFDVAPLAVTATSLSTFADTLPIAVRRVVGRHDRAREVASADRVGDGLGRDGTAIADARIPGVRECHRAVAEPATSDRREVRAAHVAGRVNEPENPREIPATMRYPDRSST